LDPGVELSVALRKQSWTYNTWGQPLTAVSVLGATTQYNYYTTATSDHARGDLESTTTRVGFVNHVTRYLRYNAFGQALETVDPNGVHTTYTYDLRQRLKSSLTGGQLTQYGYWPHGRVKSITEPNGSMLSFEYDEAQRLRIVQDSQGNRIEYTLDNAGIIINENVMDPTGRLYSQLGRAFDALGRKWQVTGRER
jgi:YD repeat-containing protein